MTKKYIITVLGFILACNQANGMSALRRFAPAALASASLYSTTFCANEPVGEYSKYLSRMYGDGKRVTATDFDSCQAKSYWYKLQDSQTQADVHNALQAVKDEYLETPDMKETDIPGIISNNNELNLVKCFKRRLPEHAIDATDKYRCSNLMGAVKRSHTKSSNDILLVVRSAIERSQYIAEQEAKARPWYKRWFGF